jgi:hypothetical protein
MPRKAKIVAVPVDAPVEQPVEEAVAPEDKTDAEEMTNVINEIKTVDEQPVAEPVAETVVEETVTEPVAEPKAKPKRAPRAKAPSRKKVKEEEPVQAEVVAVEPSLEETTVVVAMPEEKAEAKPAAVVKEKVACPDCGKEMSAKTLKYSHAPNCVSKKQKADEEQPAAAPTVSEELLEDLVQKRLTNVRQERLARKEAMMQKLISGAF